MAPWLIKDDKLIESEIARELVSLLSDVRALEFDTGGHHLQKTRPREIASALVEHFAQK